MDIAARQLQTKFDRARSLAASTRAVAPAESPLAATAANYAAELAATEMRFALTTAHIFVAAAGGSESGRAAAAAEFSRILAREGFAASADRVVDKIEAALETAGASLRGGASRARSDAGGKRRLPAGACADLQRLIDVYPRGAAAADGSAQAVDYESCPACGSETSVDAVRSSLRCRSADCGAIRELVGTVFDDLQFYSQEGQKAKSGTFSSNRHYVFWWTHLLATEPETEIGDKNDIDNLCGEKLIARLRTLVVQERKTLRLLTVADMRSMLSRLGQSSLNKNIPLLLKKLTGVGPPAIPEEISVRAENLFTKVVEAVRRIRPPVRLGGAAADRVNLNYYPYYLFKILDFLIPDNRDGYRRILYYIYVQGKDTVENIDVLWEQVCDEIGEIPYRPTDRHMGQQYLPI